MSKKKLVIKPKLYSGVLFILLIKYSLDKSMKINSLIVLLNLFCVKIKIPASK
jgi:hypothetical protein